MRARCPYCEMESTPSRDRMTVCDFCGAWFVWPRPSVTAMREYYAGHVGGMPAMLREWRDDTAQSKWYGVVAKRLAGKHATTIADVGAGAMELTLAVSRQFPDARIDSFDFFSSGVPASLPPHITARQIDLNAPHAVTGRYDIVVAVAVIEHVIDPLAFLRFLRSITKPGGLIYVVGPAADSMARRIMRKRWPYYCPDEHLTLPTLASIRAAVALSGGGAIELRHVNVHYSLKYLLRYFHVPLPLPKRFDVVLPLPVGAFELQMIGVTP